MRMVVFDVGIKKNDPPKRAVDKWFTAFDRAHCVVLER
jgi:hypothetical protein